LRGSFLPGRAQDHGSAAALFLEESREGDHGAGWSQAEKAKTAENRIALADSTADQSGRANVA